MLMTTREAAEYLRISKTVLDRLRSTGPSGLGGMKEIPYVRMSAKCIRYEKAALDKWIADRIVDDGAA